MVKAKFEIFGTKIKMTLPNRIYCTDYKIAWEKVITLDKEDLLWRAIFGNYNNVKDFVKHGKTRILKVNLKQLGLKSCDVLGDRK